MSTKGLYFDDFDLDLTIGEDGDTADAASVSTITTIEPSFTGGLNSSTSICCATATNITEDCSYCHTC